MVLVEVEIIRKRGTGSCWNYNRRELSYYGSTSFKPPALLVEWEEEQERESSGFKQKMSKKKKGGQKDSLEGRLINGALFHPQPWMVNIHPFELIYAQSARLQLQRKADRAHLLIERELIAEEKLRTGTTGKLSTHTPSHLEKVPFSCPTQHVGKGTKRQTC